jgi:hypothetical protein
MVGEEKIMKRTVHIVYVHSLQSGLTLGNVSVEIERPITSDVVDEWRRGIEKVQGVSPIVILFWQVFEE